jgi:hypothetical protein
MALGTSNIGDSPNNPNVPARDGPVQDLVSGVKEKFSTFRKFWRTRRAVLKGDLLAKKSVSELDSLGLYTSWKFNLLQSTIAAAPALFVGKLLDTLFPPPTLKGFAAEFASWTSVTLPLVWPFMFFVFTQLTAWGSLKQRDQSPQTRKIARNSFLYLDGALGLYPQTFSALGLVLVSWYALHENEPHGQWAVIMVILGGTILGIGFIWQLLLNSRIIPGRLFAINGYSPRIKSFWVLRDKGRNLGPMNKFFVVQLIGGWVALAGTTLVGYGIAALIAFIVWRVKSLAGQS